MAISVRVSTSNELPTLWKIYADAMKPHIAAIWGWDEDWQKNDFSSAFASASTYSIEINKVLSGYFQLDIDKHSNYLRMFILTPETRSKGVGTIILNHIVKKSHQNGKNLFLRVFKTNERAKRFYEREGWTVCNKHDSFFQLSHLSDTYITTPSISLEDEIQSFGFASFSILK